MILKLYKNPCSILNTLFFYFYNFNEKFGPTYSKNNIGIIKGLLKVYLVPKKIRKKNIKI